MTPRTVFLAPAVLPFHVVALSRTASQGSLQEQPHCWTVGMHQHARKCTGISCHDGHAQSVGSVGMDSNGQDGDGTGRRTCCVRGAKRQPGGMDQRNQQHGRAGMSDSAGCVHVWNAERVWDTKETNDGTGEQGACWAAEHGSRQVHAASVLPRQRPTVAQAPNCR